MEEIWKDIKGYEGLYQVSNLGRVRSLRKNIILRQGIARGYEKVILCTNNIHKGFTVHRLVAMAFIPNPDNLSQVNHKDENKTNNCVNNLEWCTQEYNQNYGTVNKRRSQKQLNNKNKSKVVLQYSLDGTFVKEWESTIDVKRNLGFDQSSISRCCRGKLKSAYGFLWKYKNEEG